MQSQQATRPQIHRSICPTIPGTSQKRLLNPHLKARRLPQRHLKESRHGRLRVQAGLNYPHMPTRMRRQIQEIKYTAQMYIAKFLHLLTSLPVLRDIVRAWNSLQAKLAPYLERCRQISANLKEEYLIRKDRYDEFCLGELKRKYRWKAYARRDEKLLVSFLKTVFYRIAVLICIAEWEWLAPGGFLWTCIAPLVVGRALLGDEDPIWWAYCAVIFLFVIIRHPIDFPLRWV